MVGSNIRYVDVFWFDYHIEKCVEYVLLNNIWRTMFWIPLSR